MFVIIYKGDKLVMFQYQCVIRVICRHSTYLLMSQVIDDSNAFFVFWRPNGNDTFYSHKIFWKHCSEYKNTFDTQITLFYRCLFTGEDFDDRDLELPAPYHIMLAQLKKNGKYQTYSLSLI